MRLYVVDIHDSYTDDLKILSSNEWLNNVIMYDMNNIEFKYNYLVLRRDRRT